MDDYTSEGHVERPISGQTSRVRISGAEQAGTAPERAVDPGFDLWLDEQTEAPLWHQPSAEPEMPHWTEAPTGEVPAILSRGEPPNISGPTWREDHSDWKANEETFEPAMLSDEATRYGSLDDDYVESVRQPWSFDLSDPAPTRTDSLYAEERMIETADHDADPPLYSGLSVRLNSSAGGAEVSLTHSAPDATAMIPAVDPEPPPTTATGAEPSMGKVAGRIGRRRTAGSTAESAFFDAPATGVAPAASVILPDPVTEAVAAVVPEASSTSTAERRRLSRPTLRRSSPEVNEAKLDESFDSAERRRLSRPTLRRSSPEVSEAELDESFDSAERRRLSRPTLRRSTVTPTPVAAEPAVPLAVPATFEHAANETTSLESTSMTPAVTASAPVAEPRTARTGRASADRPRVARGSATYGGQSPAPMTTRRELGPSEPRVLGQRSVQEPRGAHRGPPPPVPPETAAGRNVPVAITSGLVVGLVALLMFHLGPLPTAVLVTIVVALAVAELFAAMRRAGEKPATLLGIVATVSLLIGVYNKGIVAYPLVTVLLAAFTMIWYVAGVERTDPVRGAGLTLLGFGWVAYFGSFAALFANQHVFPDRRGIAFLLGAIICTVAYDIGALAVGAWIGRTPLAPNVSPKKTWEGLIGASIFTMIMAVLVVHQIHPWTLSKAALLGLVVIVLAPIGDLCESMFKRTLGLKDMSGVMPGHGGLLDRVDGLLFVLPATYYLVKAVHLG